MNINFTENKKPEYPKVYLWVLSMMFAFYAIIVTLDERNGFLVSPLLLLITTIIYFSRQRKCRRSISQQSKNTLAVIAFYALFSIAVALFHQDPFPNKIKIEIMMLAMMPLFYLFVEIEIKLRHVFTIIAWANMIIVTVALYDRYFLGLFRALGERHNAVPAGCVCMSIALFSACGVVYARQNRLHGLLIFSICGALAGIYASLLTGTRGAWLCLPPLLMLIAITDTGFNRKAWYAAFFIVAIAVALYFIPATGVASRFAQAMADIDRFSHAPNSSIGLRIQFWRSALDGIAQKPLFGWGLDGFYALQKLQAQNGLIGADIIPFGHSHNLYLDIAFKKGLVTLLVFLISLAYPLWICCRGLVCGNSTYRTYSLLGVTLIVSACSYLLTDIFLYSPIGTGLYFFSLMWIMAGLNNHRSDAREALD